MPLNVSELGQNIIQFISNLYVGVFLLIGGLVSISFMLEKIVLVTPPLPSHIVLHFR